MDPKECSNLTAKWKEDPVFRHYCFSDKKLWSKQEEILWAVRKYNRVAVKSGNTIGKSFDCGVITCDWLIVNQPARVITTAPTFSQVEGIVWKEIRSYHHKAKIPIGGDLLQTYLKLGDDWFAEGISTDNVARFQGRHNPNLLVILDEASGILPEIWETVDALHPKCVLAIGNPLDNSGKFFECFQTERWHKISISCQECVDWQRENEVIPGLVTQAWINDMEDVHGRNSAWYQSHVEGNFPEQPEGALISREWVERARRGVDCDGISLEDEDEAESVRLVGADIATKHGENETVLCYRYGHTISKMQGFRKCTATYSRDQMQSWYSKYKANTVITDSDGVGESMAEFLSEVYVPCLEFHGGYGSRAVDSIRFKNLRTQFYWVVAKKFEKGLYNLSKLDQKSYELLRGQLCCIQEKAPDGLGRTQIETKEDMAARGIKSPDYADSFVLCEYGFWMHRHAELKPMAYGNL